MAGDDDRRDDDTKPGSKAPDPDRAAILARRQRFIALALSGLTTAACDKPTTKPDACLKVKVSDPKEPATTGEPRACLDVAPPRGSSGSGDASTSGADGNVPPDDTAEPTPCLEVAPHPCLSPTPCLDVAPPSPCLRVAPSACLKVARPHPCLSRKPPPKPTPKPCLKVKAPE